MPFTKIAKFLTTKSQESQPKKLAEADLLNAESALGRTIFGAIPEGYSREFFCYRKNVWLWYEDGLTIRYEVRPDGVFKKVAGGHYQKIAGQELTNFRQATLRYLKLVKTHLYD